MSERLIQHGISLEPLRPALFAFAIEEDLFWFVKQEAEFWKATTVHREPMRSRSSTVRTATRRWFRMGGDFMKRQSTGCGVQWKGRDTGTIIRQARSDARSKSYCHR